MDLLLPWVAALVAILIVPGWSFYFDVTPKVVMVLAGAALALVFLKPAARNRWFVRILALQAIALIVATFFSTHRWFSLYGSTWRRTGFFAQAAILIFAMASAQPARRSWLRILVMVSIPVSLYAILQYLGIDPILPSGPYHVGEGKYMIVRPPATLGHASYLATYLLFAIFAAAELMRLESTRAWRSAAAAASALAFFAMILSGTRAALVGFAVGALFLAVRQRVNRRVLIAGAAAVVILAAFYISPLGERLRARVFWSSEDPLGGSRLTLWRDTIRMSLERPLTGYGPETFSMEYPRHQSIELARAFPDFYHESPHNIFLDALVSNGLLGLIGIIALAAFGLAIARGFLGAGFIAMLVGQMQPANRVSSVGRPKKPQAGTDAVSPPGTAAPHVAAYAAVALVFMVFAVYLATGDALLAWARRALDQGDPDRAANLLDRARHWNAAADFYFSRRFANAPAHDPVEHLRFWQYGFAAASHAPETADDPQNALLNLAAFQAGLNDAPGVEQNLRRAIAIAPEWYKPHWLLAQVLEQQGRSAEALSEAQAAAARDGAKHPEVAATLQHIRSR